jgi:hypothetical protein
MGVIISWLKLQDLDCLVNPNHLQIDLSLNQEKMSVVAEIRQNAH